MNRIKNVFMVLTCLVFVLLYSYSFIYADTKAESPDTGISGILQNGSEWFKSAKDKGAGDSNMGGIISDILGTKGSGGLLDAIFQIGNVVFIIVTIILGLKYMFSSIEGKVEVKESLITLGIGANNIKAIKNAIIKTVAENDTILDTDNLDISIRANSIKSRTYSDELGKEFYYVNFIVDLPNDKKSYQIVHEWGESDVAENSPYSAMVFCIRDKNKIVYKNFECKDNYKKNPKYEIIAHYLPYEDFNNYDFSISQTSNKKIYIQLPGDQEQAAIKEIKQWIETMGFSSDGFNFEAEDQTAAPPDEPTD